MYCKNCGSQIADGARFCESCGAQVDVGPAAEASANAVEDVRDTAQQIGTEAKTDSGYTSAAPAAGAYAASPLAEQPAATEEMPMKWHKFLVCFALWAGAVLNFISGISALVGGQYDAAGGDGTSELVYSVLPGLKTVDIIYGVLLIAIAAFGIYTTYNMLKMKQGAPKLLLMLYAMSTVTAVIYCIVVSAILKKAAPYADTSEIISNAITSAIVSVIMMVVNKIYYDKRKHLFVN